MQQILWDRGSTFFIKIKKNNYLKIKKNKKNIKYIHWSVAISKVCKGS